MFATTTMSRRVRSFTSSSCILIRSLTLQRDNDLLSGHALLLMVKTSLDVLETLPDDLRIRSGDIFTFYKSLWQEIHVNGVADFVVHEVTAKDELGTDAVRNYLPQTYACGDEFAVFGLEEDVCAGVECSVGADGVECGGNCLTLECFNQLLDNGLAAVVNGLASTELLSVGGFLWRGSGDDLIVGSGDELNSITNDACRTSPDEQSVAGWLLEAPRDIEVPGRLS